MRKWTCLLPLLISLLLAVSGCALFRAEPPNMPPQSGDRPPVTADNLRETVFYLPNAHWQMLIPVRLAIPWEEGIAQAALGHLVDGNMPASMLELGLAPLLPAGTTVLGLTIRDGLARVDLSEDFLKYNPQHEAMVISGLVYTLTEFPTIERVELLVQGQKPDLPGQLWLSQPFTRKKGINLEVSAEVEGAEDTEQITLYFLYPVDDRTYYVPVTRVVKKADNQLLTVAQELLRGPAPGRPLFTALPQDFTLQEISSENGRMSLTLADNFSVIGGGQLAADRMRHQLALTLTELSGVREIELLTDGVPPKFPPGIHFPALFGRPPQWNLVGSRQ